MKRLMLFFMVCGASAAVVSCSVQRTPEDTMKADNDAFINGPAASNDEVFRVLMLSDSYQVSQVAAKETICRLEDKGGDQFMLEDLVKNDKINEAREAVYTVSLYPDTGRVYQIRPKKLSNLREIDHLIVQDLQRWNIAHPSGKKKEVTPIKFDVRYRVVLRKKMSDEAILQEKREAMKDKVSH